MGGFVVESMLGPTNIMDAVAHIILHTYVLKEDNKKEMIVQSDRFAELRTRRHIGVIGFKEASIHAPECDDSGSVDSSTVFAAYSLPNI